MKKLNAVLFVLAIVCFFGSNAVAGEQINHHNYKKFPISQNMAITSAIDRGNVIPLNDRISQQDLNRIKSNFSMDKTDLDLLISYDFIRGLRKIIIPSAKILYRYYTGMYEANEYGHQTIAGQNGRKEPTPCFDKKSIWYENDLIISHRGRRTEYEFALSAGQDQSPSHIRFPFHRLGVSTLGLGSNLRDLGIDRNNITASVFVSARATKSSDSNRRSLTLTKGGSHGYKFILVIMPKVKEIAKQNGEDAAANFVLNNSYIVVYNY